MSDKKHIDRLFQEKFKDFEVTPHPEVWNKLSKSLPEKKKKRRVIALWWQIGGVAAIIALLLTVGGSVFNSNNNVEDIPVVNTDKDVITTPSDNEDTLQNNDERGNTTYSLEESVADNSNANDGDEENKSKSSHTTKEDKVNTGLASIKENSATEKSSTKNELLPKSALENIVEETTKNKTAVVDNTLKENSSNESDIINSSSKNNNENSSTEPLTKNSLKQSIEEAIAAQSKDTNEKEKVDEPSRWSIAPNVAPVYFSSLGQGSPINEQFNNNSKGSNVSMSYGIAGSYAVNKRLKVRAGINRINLNQTTSDVFAFNGAETLGRSVNNMGSRMDNVTLNSGAQAIFLVSSSMMDINSVPELFNSKIGGELEQRFGFLEVPLELEYRLLDRKFGLNVIGGFSTFFLNENEIYAEVDGTSTLIGEANNINSTSFSANFGLGLDYKLTKQWNVNLEPMFKYQINTFSNTSGDFRPFFVGVYTGLSFKF